MAIRFIAVLPSVAGSHDPALRCRSATPSAPMARATFTLQVEVSAPQRDVVEAPRHGGCGDNGFHTEERSNGGERSLKIRRESQKVAAGRASRGMDREKAGFTSHMDSDGL